MATINHHRLLLENLYLKFKRVKPEQVLSLKKFRVAYRDMRQYYKQILAKRNPELLESEFQIDDSYLPTETVGAYHQQTIIRNRMFERLHTSPGSKLLSYGYKTKAEVLQSRKGLTYLNRKVHFVKMGLDKTIPSFTTAVPKAYIKADGTFKQRVISVPQFGYLLCEAMIARPLIDYYEARKPQLTPEEYCLDFCRYSSFAYDFKSFDQTISHVHIYRVMKLLLSRVSDYYYAPDDITDQYRPVTSCGSLKALKAYIMRALIHTKINGLLAKDYFPSGSMFTHLVTSVLNRSVMKTLGVDCVAFGDNGLVRNFPPGERHIQWLQDAVKFYFDLELDVKPSINGHLPGLGSAYCVGRIPHIPDSDLITMVYNAKDCGEAAWCLLHLGDVWEYQRKNLLSPIAKRPNRLEQWHADIINPYRRLV